MLSAAIQELAAVADSRPEKVFRMLSPVLRVAARLSNTSAAGSSFDFVRRLCLADPAGIRARFKSCVLDTPEVLALAADVAKTAARARTALDGGANGAAVFLRCVYESQEAKQVLESVKTELKDKGSELAVPDLAGAVSALLDAGDPEGLKLLGLLLREDPPTVNGAKNQVQGGKEQAQPEVVQSQVCTSSFVSSVLSAGLPRRLFQTVQRDRAQTEVSVDAMKLLFGLARGSFGHEVVARRALRVEKTLLHDLFHALAYQHL